MKKSGNKQQGRVGGKKSGLLQWFQPIAVAAGLPPCFMFQVCALRMKIFGLWTLLATTSLTRDCPAIPFLILI